MGVIQLVCPGLKRIGLIDALYNLTFYVKKGKCFKYDLSINQSSFFIVTECHCSQVLSAI